MRLLLDPGHGYKGTGPTGCCVNTFVEDDFTLQLALMAAAQINNSCWGKVDMLMTRTIANDYMPLADRGRFGHNRDLVISIHANAGPDDREHGALVFVRKEAPQLAKDIGVLLLEYIDRPGEYVDKAGVLRKMQQQLHQIDQDPPLDDWRRRAHNVLRWHGGAALLLECGYATNPDDRAWMMSTTGLDSLAGAITRAVIGAVTMTELV